MSSKRYSKLLYLISLLAVILLLIFFNFFGSLKFPQNIVYGASMPFLTFFQSVDQRVFSFLNFFVNLKNLNQENKTLLSENQELQGENLKLKEASLENELLRERLELALPDKNNLILADVAGYLPQSGQYFLINKGFDDGLREGLAAVTANNFFVGKVVELGSHWAKILLMIDSDSLVSVISQESRVRGAIKGDHGLGLVMEMVPIDSTLQVGESVLTSGLNNNLPKGLLVGRISAIEKKESEIFQRAILEPAVDFSGLEQIFILLPAAP